MGAGRGAGRGEGRGDGCGEGRGDGRGEGRGEWRGEGEQEGAEERERECVCGQAREWFKGNERALVHCSVAWPFLITPYTPTRPLLSLSRLSLARFLSVPLRFPLRFPLFQRPSPRLSSRLSQRPSLSSPLAVLQPTAPSPCAIAPSPCARAPSPCAIAPSLSLTCSVGDLESLVERRWAEPVEDLVDDRDEGVAREGGEVREEAEEDEGAVSDGDDERRPRRRKRLHREAAGGGGGRERGPRTRRRDLERSTEISRRSTEI